MAFMQRMRLREEDFLGPLTRMAESVDETADALRLYLEDPANQPAPATHERRLQLDAMSEDVDRRIIEAFIAPFDPDDLTYLNAALHALGDAVDDAARLFAVLGLTGRRASAVKLATLLAAATSRLRHAVASIDNPRVLEGANARLHEVAEEADGVHQSAVSSLFNGTLDEVTVLKWKEVHDRLEHLVHMAHRAGNVLHRVAVKSEA